MRIQIAKAMAVLALGLFCFAPLANADLLGDGDTTPQVVTPPADTTPPPVVAPPVIVVTPPADTTPPVISGLANASVGDIAATIVWTTDEAAVSTFQYGTTSSYGSSATLPAGALLAHTAVLTSLSPSTTYYYCIHATDLSGNTSNACGQSFATAAVTDTTPPTVSAIAATSISQTSETATWTTSELADGQVEYGTTTSYGSTTTLNTTLGLNHSQTLSSLTPGTLYHYRVLSKDAAGNLTTSSDQTFTTAAASVSVGASDTTPPIISSVADSELGSSTATIIWISNELATSTLEYGTTTSYGSQAAIAPDALLGHSAALVSLTPSTTYYYCIHATDVAGNVANSCGHQFTTEANGTANIVSGDTTPPVISGVVNTSVSDVAATIIWMTDELAGSTLQYGTTTNYGSSANIAPDLLLVHTATLLNLSPNTTYYYCIHASDLAGNSANDCGQSFTTAMQTDSTPPAITAITATPANATAETITWATNELSSSQIEYGTTTNYGTTTTANTTLGLSHSQTLSNLATGTTYHYRVISQDAAGNITASADQNATTESGSITVTDTTPPVISNISNSELGSTLATIDWTTNELAVSGFEYGPTTRYGHSVGLSLIPSLANGVAITNLTSNTTYYYCIHATDVAGNAASSCGHQFTTETVNAPIQDPADTTPPLVSAGTAVATGATTANVSWLTDESATSQVQYGTTTSYDSQTTEDSNLETSHVVAISRLSANTEYHYRIVTTDPAGNTSTSGDATFVTDANTPVVPSNNVTPAPTVSATASLSTGPTSETVTWVTNQPTDSQVLYGMTSSYSSSSAHAETLSTTHSTMLTGLAPNTTYHYLIKSQNSGSAFAATADQDFTTAALPIPAPTILGVTSETTQDSATVTWATSIPGDSHVEYGLNTAYDNQTPEDTALIISHSQTISNLAPGTTYEFRVLSQTAGSEEAVSTNYSFTTQAASNSGNQNSVTPVAIETPTGLIATNVGQTSVTLSFSIPNTPTNEAVRYDIRYSTSPITSSNFASASLAQSTPIYFDFPETGVATTNEYEILGLNPGTTYYFAIRTESQSGSTSPISEVVSTVTAAAGNNSGNGNNTSEVIVENPGVGRTGTAGAGSGTYYVGGIAAPQNIRAAAADASSILSWNNPADTDFARVQVVRSITGYPASPNDGLIVYEGSSTNFTDTGLANGTKYYYGIFALSQLSHISAPLQFAVTPQLGVTQANMLQAHLTIACYAQDLSFGMRSSAVTQLQQYLDALDSVTYPQSLITGYFYTYTRSAVKQLQKQYSLPQTGVWDTATRTAIGMCFGAITSAPSAPVPALSRDLSIGVSGTDVTFLQQFLVNKKLLVPKYVTGYFGKLTKATVIALQQTNNIQPANGIVGVSTRNYILGQ